MAEENNEIRPDVLNYDDIRRLVPRLDGHEKLVKRLLHFLSVDKVNAVHAKCCDTPGPEFVRRLLFEEFRIRLRIDNEQVLDNLPQGAFITVSNHPFGALDGITLIYLISSRRPKFKVMVNMILNKISAMRPNFIAVDALQSNDPKKRQVSVNGIRQAIRQIKSGYFHGSNSWWSNFLGIVCWPARSLRLPAEVFRKVGKELHVSIGNPISVEEQAAHDSSPEELGKFLRERTYALRELYR